ncbi:hypothetical protein P2318_27310 [Myxococcaceae bacterium GXIMD 01537]
MSAVLSFAPRSGPAPGPRLDTVHLLLLGVGTVGGNLLQQLAAQQEALVRTHGVALSVVGLANTRRAVFDARGLDLARWRESLEQAPSQGSAPDVRELLGRLRRFTFPVLVDCTAAEGMEALYEEAFRLGIHVVAANKKPLTLPLPSAKRLHAMARCFHRAYLYETTVGASLPVIQPLQDFVRTGDRVHLIEGSLSGTLGYLCNEVTRGVPLSVAVREARRKGYTEPHPRDDLAGTDAARKALILARELGLAVSLENVEVEPFVSRELLAENDVERFLSTLEAHDGAFAERVASLRASGQVLRYLARVEPGGAGGRAALRVGPVAVPEDHPATRLRGTEAFVSFSTERYSEYPLRVQGAGAGGAITAAGVLADVLRMARVSRGH